MKAPTPGMLAVGLLGVTVFTLMMVGSPAATPRCPNPNPQGLHPAAFP
jgi:hypothetical protein